MAKTAKMQDLDEIIEIFENYRENGGDRDSTADEYGRIFERRNLGGKDEWEETNPWNDGINTERYEYRLEDAPAMRLSEDKKMVEFNKGDATGEERSVDFVRLLSFRCRSCRKAKKKLNFMTGNLGEDADDEGKAAAKVLGKEAVDLLVEENDDYEVTIQPDGGIVVGCSVFEWEDINAFARKMGWWK